MRIPKLENIFIDIGAKDKAKVEKMGVHVGCVITYPDTFQIINKNKFICRAIGNRAGGFIIAEVGRLLNENKIDLPLVCTLQILYKRIGLRGAEMITNTIKPDVAIVTDVCHDTTTPMINQKQQGDTEMGKGPVISRSSSP